MKISYVSSVFSGLMTSISQQKWAPTGVPTIYKVIEALDRSVHETQFLFIEKRPSAHSGTGFNKFCAKITIKGIGSKIFLLPFFSVNVPVLGKIFGKISEALQIAFCCLHVVKSRSELVYCDRANVLIAAVFARYTSKKTVLRVMGVYPSMWEILERSTLYNRILSWAFASPFDLVICTEDGTDGQRWVRSALPNARKVEYLLNGISISDYTGPTETCDRSYFSEGKTAILFVGRLEEIKGWREFVQALIALPSEVKQKVSALLVGAGEGQSELQELLQEADLQGICKHIERVSHQQIHDIQRHADIYVSMNKLGNLSNANLESFFAGLCVIIPESDLTTGADLSTDKLLPKETLVRIPRNQLVQELSATLVSLVENPAKIEFYKAAMKGVAPTLLRSWDERIKAELKLIEDVCAT